MRALKQAAKQKAQSKEKPDSTVIVSFVCDEQCACVVKRIALDVFSLWLLIFNLFRFGMNRLT